MKVTKDLFIALMLVAILGACGGTSEQKSSTNSSSVPADKNKAGDPFANKGIGPVKEVKLGEINTAMAAEGQEIFTKMCSACHKPAEKFIGPAPKGILERRSPEWVMNMILNPEEMIKSDPVAKQLMVEANLAPMANQNLTEEQARKVLEYFRTIN